MTDKRKRLQCEDYHVAWICPVADLELVPARLMLDEEHDSPQYDTHFDDNTYVFGSIKGHTVVIGTLPAGETANVNAARLSGSLFRTFPNIRMALLVGIGGGIPRATISTDALENVHLGDVVVGWPGDGKPACVYHSRGRAKTGGFEIVGMVQNPDWRLTAALGVLKTDYEMEKTSFNEHLTRLQSSTRLKKRFAHPGFKHDKLFKTTYPHEGEYRSGCTACKPSELVSRPKRTREDQDTFVVHFGRIASGDSVIQNALLRDEIRSRCDGALCVEMEAAGVDASRRCLVIRGISDYADSHKSDLWRSYAAGKAAAFARELLCKVQPGVVKDINPQTQTQDIQQAAWLVPLPRPPSYVGREAQLSRLKTHISSTNNCRLAVYGLGGCGKTALALETAYHLRETHPERAVFWVPAISQSSFEQAFRQIGEQLRIPKIMDSKSDAKHLVKAKLSDESAGSWLLIVDNADDLDILYSPLDEDGSVNRLTDYLPHSRKGSIVFTTRTKQVAVDLAGTNVVELGKLDEQEAKDLLKTRLLPPAQHMLEDEAIVKELLNILTFFALAIVQAVAFINKTDSSLADYVRLYKANEQAAVQLLSKEFEDQGRYRETKNPIATTWYITFEQIRKNDKLAADFLSFMACTTNTNIPATMLPEPDLEMNQIEALGILKAYGFVSRRQPQLGDEDEHEVQEDRAEAFDIHPLVHLATRIWLQEHDEWPAWVEKTAKRMRDLLPPFEDIMTRKVWTPYLPHARHVCDLARPNRGDSWADLIWRVANCHYALGQYRVAEQDFRALLAYQESALGEKHPDTLQSSNYIGETLREQKKLQKAEQMHRRTLALREEVLGNEDHDTLASMNHLAITLENQGKYVEAEQMHRQELLLREKVSGKEHSHTLGSMHNLAAVLNSQRKFAEAEQMFRETIELKKKVLGKEHQKTINSMSWLAGTLNSQRKYEEAEEMYRKTLSLMEKVLGKEHPDTLTNMNNLASTLRKQGKYKEAEDLHRRTLGLQEKVLGTEHTDTMVSMNNLASTLSNQGKHQEAEDLHRRVLGLREKVLSEENTATMVSMGNLALTLSNQGKHQEAEDLHRRVLGLREKVLGEEDTNTMISMNNLASTLSDQGKHQEAEDLHRRVLGLREKVLGEEDTNTMISMNNLASTLSDQGKHQEAEDLHRRVLGLREKVLGTEHTDTMVSMNNLALTLSDQGKHQEAEDLFRRTLGLQEKVLGMEQTDTLRSAWWIGFVLREQHRYKEALSFYERAYNGLKRNLGMEHSITRSCAEQYASARKTAGGWRSDYEESSLSDEAYDSLGEQLNPEDIDSDDSDTRILSQRDKAAREEDEEVDNEEEEPAEEYKEDEEKEQSHPSYSLALEGLARFEEMLSHTRQSETRSHPKNHAFTHGKVVNKESDIKKGPPPLKAKPAALKGLPLRDLMLDDQTQYHVD